MQSAVAKPVKWNFLLVIMFWQLMVYVTVFFDILVARQVIGFVYLTFIPGYVLVRLLKLDKLDTTETILFSVGLSITFLMLCGLLINELYPLFNISTPLSSIPLLITISIFVFSGAVLSYWREHPVQVSQGRIGFQELFLILYSVFLLFLGIYGAILNWSGNNLFLLFLLAAIAVWIFLVAISEKIVSQKLYPIILFVVCIMLLFFAGYTTPFASRYITGMGDQWIEYYAFKSTEINYHWDSLKASSPDTPTLFPTYSMLSVTILPLIFSQISGLDSSWTFAILYNIFIPFVVLGVYKLFTTQTNKSTAFLATFFFITISTSKGWGSAKQMLAQLFLVLLFFLLFDKKLSSTMKKVLFALFSFALVTSHYSLSYLFIFTICLGWLFSVFLERLKTGSFSTSTTKIPLSFVLIYLTIAFSWGIYINASASFNILLDTVNTVLSSLNQFFNPASRGTALMGLGITQTPTIIHQMSTILFLITEFFIVIGFLRIMKGKEQMTYDAEYKIFCGLNLAIIALNILLPRLADTFLMSRFYQTTLILLAPLGILGGQTLVEYISKTRIKKKSAAVLALAVFVPLFLFQTGFIYEIANVSNDSFPLSIHRWDDLRIHDTFFETEEVYGAFWLPEHTNVSNSLVYSDVPSRHGVLTGYSLMERGHISFLTNVTGPYLSTNEFIYLRYTNVVLGKIETYLLDYYIFNTTELYPIFENQNKIYSNGPCEIYSGYLSGPP